MTAAQRAGSRRDSPAVLLVRVVPVMLLLAAVMALSARTARAQGDEEEEPASCFSCHAVGATREGAPAGATGRVDPALFARSAHRKSCVMCHEDMEEVPHRTKKAAPVECANCHEEDVEKYRKTPHAKLSPDGGRPVPTCSSCHPPHAVLDAKEPDSSVHRDGQIETCGACHGGEQVQGDARVPRTVADFERSVHGVELLEEHNEKAPACTTCHPIHDMRPGSDPASPTFKPNVPKLCGQCHADIEKEYGASIHGKALAAGRMDSPACNDCHSEHSIARPGDESSTVFATHVSKTCSSCHAAERITRRYGLAADRVETYRDSYHGLADLGGSTAAANCASCHGFHDVLPSSDPKSRIHADRLLETCRACHQGAAQGFVEGRVHAAPDEKQDPAAYWVRLVYLVLIPVTIGGMLLHNGVIFLRYVREKYRAQKASTTYVRFRGSEVAVHAMIAASFIVLAVTGFALAFPEAAWVRGLASLGLTEGPRGWLHRAAAVVFAAGSVWHVAYVVLSRHGRYAFGRMVPRLQDLRDARQNVLWHLGLAKAPPRFDRWDYTMKVEYWALAWGGLVMGVTGALLWFKEEVSAWMPRWGIYVAERIHYYEAILAVLAIVVWHFFFVIFHPAEYPMNLTWLTGRKTEDEMRHAHPAEYDRLRDSAEYRRPPEAGSAGAAAGHGPGPEGSPPA